jgi:hypothetical protein
MDESCAKKPEALIAPGFMLYSIIVGLVNEAGILQQSF